MISALSAAGVRYVIASLWYVEDTITSKLMEKFYYFYMIEHQSPPVALKSAKASMSLNNDNDKISLDGFVCYQCNF